MTLWLCFFALGHPPKESGPRGTDRVRRRTDPRPPPPPLLPRAQGREDKARRSQTTPKPSRNKGRFQVAVHDRRTLDHGFPTVF